ncbi:DUF4145 domain-containing protein [Microvirga sp. VF16]|uniref:DUF4145 domain-containing protein n=1 Tax=Microvirga sp. VF16 TaxID=2807101 RepID=UPI00193D263A|nr:DUF4145 domain-containing protein [Microvirga sp. VF16]QRM31080.1 DUF4145 domain-containing protein [Microvirga sp. VF16]
MTLTRKHWQPPFDTWPSWMCPICQAGTLIVAKDGVKSTETGPSVKAHEHEAWDPDWTESRFVATFVCVNAECGEVVVCCGKSSVDVTFGYDHLGYPEKGWQEVFTPHFFSPALRFFAIPPECPVEVAQEISRAFAAAWSDLGSAANRTRSAVEALLTERKVPKTTINKNGKRVGINLHDRIVRFRSQDAEGAAYLEAVKWLGNTGSHSAQELSLDDILDGFEVFEHALHHIYVQRDRVIKRIAKEMTRRKGRPKPRGNTNRR